jgi:hypothetical protein
MTVSFSKMTLWEENNKQNGAREIELTPNFVCKFSQGI